MKNNAVVDDEFKAPWRRGRSVSTARACTLVMVLPMLVLMQAACGQKGPLTLAGAGHSTAGAAGTASAASAPAAAASR